MEAPAREFLRALRGRRSQVQLARRLGYRGNPVTDWERGQRFPTAEEALRVAQTVGVDVGRALHRFAPNVHVNRVGARWMVGEWLAGFLGLTTVSEFSARSGYSRFSLARWFTGRAKPRLPTFFQLLDALTQRLPEFVAELVPIEQVPSLGARHRAGAAARQLAYQAPWTEAVLRLLETEAYRRLGRHRPGFIGSCLGLSPEEETECLHLLERAQVVERRRRGFAIVDPNPVDTRGGKEALHHLKEHWTRVAASRLREPRTEDLFAYNVMSVSEADLGQIREKLSATFREIRSIVTASKPEQVVALVNLQLLTFDPGRAGG
jgi:transcriptional regulator with XRE-family HTH domain